MIANIKIGVAGSIVPSGVNPSSQDRCPSWKIHVTTPKAADSETTFIVMAFTGSTTDPNARNSSTNVAVAIAPHAFGKLTMFFVAGAVAVETGKTKISQLDGIGRRMPREFVAFTLAALSMIALPPMAGFVAKWFLSVGAWNAGYWWVPLLLVVSSALNVGYWLPILIRAFFRPYEGEMGEARPTLAAPLIVVGLALAAYNVVRFGSPLDFGYGAIVSGQDQQTGCIPGT